MAKKSKKECSNCKYRVSLHTEDETYEFGLCHSGASEAGKRVLPEAYRDDWCHWWVEKGLM